jgi:signal transduction histidine kinase
LRRSNARLDLLAETAGALLRTDSPQRVVEDLCRKVMAFLDCQVFFNFMLEDGPEAVGPEPGVNDATSLAARRPATASRRGRLHLKACGGIPDEDRRRMEWIDLGVAVCGCAARDGCRIVAENIRETPDPRTDLVESFGLQAYACHPLLGQEGQVLGTLSFGTRTRTWFTDEELSLMNTVADHVSIAMERQRAGEVIRALNADLERRVRDRTAELEASNRELEAFCYSVSHDLRGPLRGIDGFSQALLEDHADKLDADGRQDLHWIRSECQKMGQLIDDLLNLSRLTRSAMQPQPVDLTALAQRIAAGLQQTAPARRAQFRIADGLRTTGDPQLLQIALSNLLDNAWKYTGQRDEAVIAFGSVRMEELRDAPAEARRGPAGRVYFVRDNGVGFDMAYADKLFAPFQRLHSVKEFPGTGIGLATVQRVIHRHGGRIWVEARPGQGATFYFTFTE